MELPAKASRYWQAWASVSKPSSKLKQAPELEWESESQ
jgi:hypothetical protein